MNPIHFGAQERKRREQIKVKDTKKKKKKKKKSAFKSFHLPPNPFNVSRFPRVYLAGETTMPLLLPKETSNFAK